MSTCTASGYPCPCLVRSDQTLHSSVLPQVASQRKAIKQKIAARQESTAAVLAEEEEVWHRHDAEQVRTMAVQLW